jgi:DNA repair exonuclease SbcCD nuclease subunit
MYAVKVRDLMQLLRRAHENNVDFVLHAGDFSNDYSGSPEIVKNYLENEYDLSVYGVYGNHELESKNNSMEAVTPLLTNDARVIWGTEDGRPGDGSIGYYYFEKQGCRFVCLDTNYSYNEGKQAWEHNTTASWGAPAGNLYPDSLGPVQLRWLEAVLTDAAEQGIPCILVSHAGFVCSRKHSPDTEAVQALIRKANARTAGTVILCINGHYHTNHLEMKENVVYFDVNAVINGSWVPKKEQHYSASHTFAQDRYDAEGKYLGAETVPLSNLWQSANTHYFREPLSAIVTVGDDGTVQVEGSKTGWVYDVAPEDPLPGIMPWISGGNFVL